MIKVGPFIYCPGVGRWLDAHKDSDCVSYSLYSRRIVVVVDNWLHASLRSAIEHLEDLNFTRKEAVEYIKGLQYIDCPITGTTYGYTYDRYRAVEKFSAKQRKERIKQHYTEAK